MKQTVATQWERLEANQDGCSWRMLGRYTDLSWQTLHRRYRGKPPRPPPPPDPDAAREERRQRRRPAQVAVLTVGDEPCGSQTARAGRQ